MPGAEERILRRRITSVQNTKKITRAMELISASRVVKAQQAALASRPYAQQLTAVIEDLSAGGVAIDHPLLREVDVVTKTMYIVLASDRGLAGGYNSTVIRAAEREILAGQKIGEDYSLITVGKKVQDYFAFRDYRIDGSFNGVSDRPTYESAREIAEVATEQFNTGDCQRVVLVYTEFVSIGRQNLAVRGFLPLQKAEVIAEEGEAEALSSFEFEPSPEGVLTSLLPRYVEARLFSALLDAAASEHASRQRAMKAATDNADDLMTTLSRRMNRARQDAITTEIMEIIGGAEGLKDDDADVRRDHDETFV